MNDNHDLLCLGDELKDGPYAGFLLEDVIDEYPEYVRERVDDGELLINIFAKSYLSQV